ncbi:MAG TPA: CBS domain-containing protein [Longimicrobiales bacterium]
MLRVRDIMQTNVATASPDMTVRELARLWEEHGISGTPVCDASGKVLGVVSATDLVRLAAEGVDESDIAAREVEYPPEEVEEDSQEAAWYHYLANEAPELYGGLEGITKTAFEEATVGEIMTRAIFSVRPNATVAELARFLLRAGIHRALVMEAGKLIGIVTASDVLRVVAGEENGAAAATAVEA